MLPIETSARVTYYSLRLGPFEGHRGTICCRLHALPQPVENTVLHSPLHRPLHWAYMGFYTGRYIAPYIGPCIGPCIGAGRHREFRILICPRWPARRISHPRVAAAHALLQPRVVAARRECRCRSRPFPWPTSARCWALRAKCLPQHGNAIWDCDRGRSRAKIIIAVPIRTNKARTRSGGRVRVSESEIRGRVQIWATAFRQQLLFRYIV